MTVTVWSPGVVLGPADLSPAMIAAIQEALSIEQVLALTAEHEAAARLEPGRGWVPNPPAARLDIMNVCQNRVNAGRHDVPRFKGLGLKDVCLQHRQFSCWDSLGGPDNFYRLMKDAQQLLAGELPGQPLLDALAMAHTVAAGGLIDFLRYATHYYATSMPAAPAWAAPPAVMTMERYGHRFFAGVR